MSNSLGTYLASIARYPVLSDEAQLVHCRRIQRWIQLVHPPEPGSLPPLLPADAPAEHRQIERAGRRSLEAMTKTNLRLVITIAKRYQHRGLDILDLIQEGNLGLVRGLILFDPSRGYKLSTYVYWWIRQGITRALNTMGRPIRLPINNFEILAKMRKHVSEHLARTGQVPSLEATAEAVGQTKERISEIIQLHQSTITCSFDRPADTHDAVDSDNDSFGALMADPASLVDPLDAPEDAPLSPDAVALNDFIEELPGREAYVVQEMYYEQKNPKEIGEELGLTASRVNQIARTAKFRLKGKIIYLRARRKYGPPPEGDSSAS